MTLIYKLLPALALCFAPVLVQGQILDPATLTKPLADSWPTYSGDYSGKRYSGLTQINQANVKNLTLAWAGKVTFGAPSGGGGGGRGFAAPAAPTIIGGEGTADMGGGGGGRVGGSMLMVNGILYASAPDNAWAVDARDGHELWHYFWKTRGGTHIGNRGMGLWGNWLYLETPDDYLVSLDARTGKERWHKTIADFDQQYFSTMAPIIVGNHVIVGTGNDLDAPGFLQSFDPETGEVQWKWYATPQEKGDPGLDSWKNLDASRHGGGHMWVPGSYDPETHLYIVGTGNPTPAYTSQARGPGDNLYTCSLVAINVDTGKLAWYYQTSPHDTHDWDSAQTPVLVNAEFDGKMRKLVLQGARNGFFFVVDRTNGEHLVTSKFSDTVNWAKGVDKQGRPVREPAKDFDIAGALVSPANGGITNWPPASFSPQTGLFYVPQHDSYSMYYLTETDPRGAMGLGGKEEIGVGSGGDFLTAIDYKTGKIAWRHRSGGATGLLTTAGHLLFGGDTGGNLVAYDPENGKPLWHTHLGQVSNAPQTYMLDGHQYLLEASGDTLYAFMLY
jgi:alcohol dehydrogenase (cytochrome c)